MPEVAELQMLPGGSFKRALLYRCVGEIISDLEAKNKNKPKNWSKEMH